MNWLVETGKAFLLAIGLWNPLVAFTTTVLGLIVIGIGIAIVVRRVGG
jgi:hypothetical protein